MMIDRSEMQSIIKIKLQPDPASAVRRIGASSQKGGIFLIFLRYTWDHIEKEDFTNFLTPFEQLLPFAIRHIGSWREGPGYYTKRRNPNDYYLLYTVSGCGRVSYRQTQVLLKPCQICLIDGAEMHTYKTEGSEWHSLWFHLTGNGMAEYFRLLNPGNSFHPVTLPDPDRAFAFYRLLKPNLNSGDYGKALDNCSAIVAFLNDILRQCSDWIGHTGDDTADPVCGSGSMKQFNDIKLYIENNMHTVITRSQICNHFKIAPQQLEKLFWLYEHMTLTDYIKTRYQVFRTPDHDRISVDHPDWLLDAIAYMNEHFTADIKIKDIIADYHVSKTVFIRKFKQYTCMHPLEYLIQLRLEHARGLLEKTDKKISAIALESGFPSASNFTARFKTWTGRSPSEYKKERPASVENPPAGRT